MLFLQSYDLVGCLGSMHTLTTDLQLLRGADSGILKPSYSTIIHICIS